MEEKLLVTSSPHIRSNDTTRSIMLSVLIALALHDRRQLGRVHPVTIGAALVLVPFHATEPLIARSQFWNSLAPGLFGFG